MTEKELCDEFVTYWKFSNPDGTVYPDQSGFDLLLVDADGTQTGVEAKKVANVKVLLQALPENPRTESVRAGPSYRAVLVAGFAGRTVNARHRNRSEFLSLAHHLRVVVYERVFFADAEYVRFDKCRGLRGFDSAHYLREFSRPLWLPPFVLDLEAGVPNPRTVSPWMVAASELEIRHDETGYVVLDDARELTERHDGTWNPRTLLTRYYLAAERNPGGRGSRWRSKARMRASREFPEVFESVREIHENS